ncbi:MAG: 4Fe-4S binding protein, partial [Deltaproteobacteria bacterium]|nr:4Fe-4S binding protein [Deltaproteobacteria bacterium]
MLKIDDALCIGCGICEEQCPFAAIEVVDGIAIVGDTCNLCGA